MLNLLGGFSSNATCALICAACFGCAGAPAPRPRVAPPPQASEPPALAGAERSAPIPSPLLPAPPGVPAAPEPCDAFVHANAVGSASCDALTARSRLDAALQRNGNSQDAELALLEHCDVFPAGWVRALRAELSPVGCADTLAADFFDSSLDDIREAPESNRRVPADIEQTLVGLAIAARLQRLTDPVPAPPGNGDRAQFQAYFEAQLKPWVLARARTVHELALQGSALRGYGRGVVAVEAAVADLEFVGAARAVPLPVDMEAEPSVREAYYSALDEALEPRKRRGRDAALVGLNDFAELGIIHSTRLERARAVLAVSYAGHRITALDGLLLPPLPPLDLNSQDARLAAALPTFYAQHVLTSLDVADPTLLRALLSQGIFPGARARLDAAPLTYDASALYARALVSLGQRYWRAGDFSRAARVASVAPTHGQRESPPNLLLKALAIALESGPKDAAHMMLGGPLLPEGVGNVSALDELSKGEGAIAAMAAYNAAYVLAFLPPQTDVRQFWQGIARRYELAAAKQPGTDQAAEARTRAKNARETARAVH